MQKNSSILSLLTLFLLMLVLSACGSKGALYQTSETKPVMGKQAHDAQEMTETQPKKID